jgi:hypothetical protein
MTIRSATAAASATPRRSTRHVTRWAAMAILATLVTIASVAFPVGSALADPPAWSSGGAGWSGSGSAFMPGGSFVGPPKAPNDPCPGCSWSVYPICKQGDSACRQRYACGAGSEYSLVFFGRGGATPALLGGQCVGGAPVSVHTLGQLVAQRVEEIAPKARIGFQPASTALTSVPTVFQAGQKQTVQRSEIIAGIPVDFEAVARWRWTWGDGSTTTTNRPGGRWPDMSLTHTYRLPGDFTVGLRTTWTATYTVNGRGPLPVTGGPIVLKSTMKVPVAQARALLVSP